MIFTHNRYDLELSPVCRPIQVPLKLDVRCGTRVAQQLNRPVVKAFNNIYAQHLMELGGPEGTPGRIALPVAGDDPAAKAIVLQLIDELGFDGVDAGSLDESWRQQPGTPVYGTDFDADGVRRALSEGKQRAKAAMEGNLKK